MRDAYRQRRRVGSMLEGGYPRGGPNRCSPRFSHSQQLPAHRMQVIMLHLQSVSPCRWPSTKVRTPSCFRIGVEVTTEEDAERLTQDHRVCKDLGHQGLNSGGHTTSQSTQVARRMRCDGVAVASVACPQAAGAAVLELAEEAEQRANRGLGDAARCVAGRPCRRTRQRSPTCDQTARWRGPTGWR